MFIAVTEREREGERKRARVGLKLFIKIFSFCFYVDKRDDAYVETFTEHFWLDNCRSNPT